MPTSVLAAGHTWAPVDGRPVECRPCRLRYPVRQRGIRRCRLAGQDHKFRLAWVDPRRCVAPARGAGVNWRDVLRRAGIPLATRPRVGLLRRPPPRPAPPRATSLDACLSLVWACRPCRLPAYKAVDDNPLTQRPHGHHAHKCQKHVEVAGTQAPDQHLRPNKSELSTPWLWNIESIDAAIITDTMRQVVHGLPLISRRSSTSPCRPGQHDSRRRKRSGCKDMAERRGQRHQGCGRHQGKDGDAEAQVQHPKPWSWQRLR